MTHKMYGALIASLGAVALLLAADPALARPGAAARGGSASTHAVSHPTLARSLRHIRRNNAGGFWPGGGFFYDPSSGFYDPASGEPVAGTTQPTSGDIHYTNTYDVPWDWAHRYPPAVAPSDRPYVPSCGAETVTVPGHGGEHTVNVVRCY
jgi:hypothetical protein